MNDVDGDQVIQGLYRLRVRSRKWQRGGGGGENDRVLVAHGIMMYCYTDVLWRTSFVRRAQERGN